MSSPSVPTWRKTACALARWCVLLFPIPLFLWPGVWLVRDLADPAMAGPGIPARAREIHSRLTPRLETWARERVATKAAEGAPLHDVPTTEWPMFTAVFYLLATEELVLDWERGGRIGPSPAIDSRGALEASVDLLLDPSHHAWVKEHWGDDYLHRNNVFFRSLLIAGLASYERATGDGRTLAILRDQVETLACDLDGSELGLLEDYPGECYPIDVVAAIGFIRRADAVLGTDHSAFVERSRRAFEGPRSDRLGLVPFRVDLPSGTQLQPGRGIGTSWVLLFAPDLWGIDDARATYETYEANFYDRRWWAEGFREWARDGGEPEWGFEIDAGPVLDGLGTAASAFGIAAARRNGRFDQAYALSSEMSAAGWTLPDGTLALPRAVSHAADAPHLGEAALAYFLTVQPAPGAPAVAATGIPPLARIGLVVYFGVPGFIWLVAFAKQRRRRAAGRRPGP